VKSLSTIISTGYSADEVKFLSRLGQRPFRKPEYTESYSGLQAKPAVEEGIRMLESADTAAMSQKLALLDRAATYFRHALHLKPDYELAHRQLGKTMFNKELSLARQEGCQGFGEPFMLRANTGRAKGVGVVLVHDYGAKPGQMRQLGEHLQRRGYWVYGMRLPGHGRSHHSLDYSRPCEWFNTVEDAFWLMNEMTSRTVVVGQGIGAILALLLGAHLREVSGIISLAAPVKLKAYWMRLAPMLYPMVKYRMQKLYNENNKAYHRYIPIKSIGGMRGLIFEFPPHLRRVTCPVLLMQSRKDDFSYANKSPQIIAGKVNSRVCRIRYAGDKYVLTEKNSDQEQINEICADFVSEITNGGKR